MTLPERDRAIVTAVSRFGQLSTSHITQLLFSHLSSHTPADRSLRRLVDQGYLARIPHRIVGGSGGGAGQWVYQLGLEGHKLYRDGRWIPGRAINFHSLAIADCHVMLNRLAKLERLRIVGFMTEPDCHVTIGKHELKPDYYAELTRPDGSSLINFMFEIDMGSQGKRQITEKLIRYWGAYNEAELSVWPTHQFVIFIAVDDQRAGELRWLLSKGDENQRSIFKVHTLAELEAQLW
jgi:hypothetical protein